MKYALVSSLISISTAFADLPKDLVFSNSSVEKSLFRETYRHLSDDLYEKKLELSLEDPLMFFRSFVNTYYQDLSSNTNLGTMGLCLGDPHAENFGFIEFSNSVEYVFNDLDDAAHCPLALDALRYFTSLELMEVDKSKIEILIEYYQKIARQEVAMPTIDAKFIPNLKDKRAKLLKKYSKQNKLIIQDPLIALSSSEKNRLLPMISKQIPQWKIFDIAFMLNEDGGSGGLKRYWILVLDENNQKDLVELKELSAPGSSYGPWGQSRVPLATLKTEIWKNLTTSQYFEIKIDQSFYLTRSRAKDDINLDKLSATDLEKILKVQVSILAENHRKQWSEAGSDDFVKWLKAHFHLMSARYFTTYNQM